MYDGSVPVDGYCYAGQRAETSKLFSGQCGEYMAGSAVGTMYPYRGSNGAVARGIYYTGRYGYEDYCKKSGMNYCGTGF